MILPYRRLSTNGSLGLVVYEVGCAITQNQGSGTTEVKLYSERL